jgi:hypothetical protein
MALSNTTTNALLTQYYDDWYAQSNTQPELLRGEEFDFHRILFRPRFAVQSRELTQLQTILQAQLERFGKSAFRDGEAVLGGQLTLDTTVTSGKVLSTTNLVAFFDRTTNTGKYILDPINTGNKARVLQFVGADEGIATNNYLVYKYQSAGTFSPGTVVQAADDAQITATFSAGVASDVFTQGSIVSIDEGVFFISGFFVRVAQQTIVLNPFSQTPSYRIGLEIDEQVLDELDDVVGESLLDPANQNAPGAHRFRVKLTLGKRSIASSADSNFVELARVIDGVIQQTRQTQRFVRMDELNQILARRTFDQAGDYLVRPFLPVVSKDASAEDHFVLALGPGKAYVRGFEIETAEPTQVRLRKGRVTATATNRDLPTRVGNFVYATRLGQTSPTNYYGNTALVDIHCVNVASIDTTSTATYNRSRIGQAKVRMLEAFNIPANTSLQANNSVYKLFFYDVAYDAIAGTLTSAAANGVATTAQALVANGLPTVNGAIEGATILLSGSNSPITGTFTVNNYITNTTVAFITFKEFLPTLPNANTAYTLLFQTKDVDALALYNAALTTATAPLKVKFDYQADVDPTSKVTGTPTGNTVVNDTDTNALLYYIPERFPKANSMTSNTATFTSWIATTSNAQTFGSTNTNFTISVSGTNFSLPTGSLSATAATRVLLIFDQTADANGRGKLLQFSDTPSLSPLSPCVGNVVIGSVGSTYNISFTYFNGDNATTRSLVGMARTTVIGLSPRQKTLVIGNTTAVLSNTSGALNAGQIEFHTLNAVANFAYSLKTPDVFRIRKVLYKSSNTAFANSDLSTATDVTSLFSFDDGQRDNTYEYSRLIVGTGAAATVRTTGRLLVIFDWFSHSGRGYISVDSYLSSANLLNGLTYDLIPGYKSPKSSQMTVNLRDVLDFRPARSNFEFTTANLVFTAADATSNTTYLTSTGTSYLIPASDADWLGSYDYYLSRIDKVALATDGTFHVLEGVDAISPTPPADENGNLLLFQVGVPAYTLVNANGVPTTTSLTTFDHKRFTMQDLSKMDDRVAHLEYYTALNSLERITREQNVEDVNGNDRFKNGILVDSFHGSDVADVARPDYTASIDQQHRELRTAFRSLVLSFAPDIANSTSSGVSAVGDIVIPTYVEKVLLAQPLATHAVSVNPFDVASFYGHVQLCPAVDIWKETNSKPAQVIDLGGPSEAWVNAERPSFTTWGEWDQTWSGVTSRETQRQFFTPPGWTPESHGFRSMTELSWQDVETSSIYERQGTTYEYDVTSTSQSLGNKVVDVSVVHFMRPRDIVFAADGLKPRATVYPFFDATKVTNYTQQANILQLAPMSASVQMPFYIGQTLYVQKAVTGNVASTNGSAAAVGSGTKFQFELVAGQLVRIVQGVNTFDKYVANIVSNTSLTFSSAASQTLANATLYTLTPVTLADIAPRHSGNTVTYTLKVVRVTRDADSDDVCPYPITAGSLRPEKHVNDAANTTSGAFLLMGPSPRYNTTAFPTTQTANIVSAVIKSGVVRAFDGAAFTLRFDTDITDSVVSTVGTTVYLVAGPSAGAQTTILSYNAATQTAVVSSGNFLPEPGQTIYSIGPLVTDGLVTGGVASGRGGTIAGALHLPAGLFAVGTRQFRLTDSANNTTSDATTAAETSYTASGISYTQQETSVSSRQLGLRRKGPASESFTVRDHALENFDISYVDPLAETFLIDSKLYPQGVFLTSVDLCFASVPDDDVPVTIELRSVVNGYPSSSELVPCVSSAGVASVTLRNDQVVVTPAPTFDGTAGAQALTRFTFSAPVHLLPAKEYALVVRSDSSAYTVYTAELGKTVIGTTDIVAKQPYAGSFFKSQNASTWTESPFEDLMFRLNRATWNATSDSPQTGVVVLRSMAPSTNTTFDSIEFYPHDVQFGDLTAANYTLDIKPLNATTNDLTGSVAVRYFPVASRWQPLSLRSMVQGNGGTIAALNSSEGLRPFPSVTTNIGSITSANCATLSAALTTWSSDVAPFIDTKKVNMLCVRHLISNMGLQASDVMIVNPGSGYLPNLQLGLLTTTSGSPIITGDANTNFSSTLLVGDTLIVGGNLEFVVLSITNTTQLVATANATASRAANTFWRYGVIGANNAVNVTVTAASTGGNGATGYATVGSDGKVANVTFTANGDTYLQGPTVTPAAPANAAGFSTGVTLQSSATLRYNGELAGNGGNALTRYITRTVTLADGFDARDLVVYFDAYRPAGSNFYVYYKIMAGDQDTSRFVDQNWRLMTQVTANTVVSSRYSQFKEFQFSTPTGRAFAGTGDTTDKFKVWAIKIVMASTGTTDVPRITNFRAMALDT